MSHHQFFLQRSITHNESWVNYLGSTRTDQIVSAAAILAITIVIMPFALLEMGMSSALQNVFIARLVRPTPLDNKILDLVAGLIDHWYGANPV